jgi:hypothetical protein
MTFTNCNMALKTPRKIIERLHNMHEFQGARYEILVASLFARCGFDIEFVDDQAKKNPEWEAMKCFEQRKCEGLPEQDSGLILSNIGWHYHRDLGAPPPEFVTVKPEQPAFPLRSETWGLLERALNEYGVIVDEENPPKPKRKTTPGWLHYGYFVKGPGNTLRAAGESFARTPDTYRKGDSLGVRSGVEGIVVSVIRAENPDSHDFDVLVVVEERLSVDRK